MEEERGTSAWHKVPTWDGAPTTWRRFKREMSWWVSSLDLESTRKYNLAARWLLRQTGVVRQRGEEFTPQELQYKPAEVGLDPQTEEEIVLVEEDLLYGLNKLLDALEAINGKTELDRKGELRSQFYLELSRKPGERISEFCTRFRTLSADLRNEGIHLPSSELGWFLREKVGLDSIRKQLLETALNGRDSYEAVEGEILRLFKDIHTADPLQKRFGGGSDGKPSLMSRFLSSSQTSGTRSSNSSGGGRSFPASSTRSFRSSTGSTSSFRSDFRPKPFTPNAPRQSLVTEMDPLDEEADDGDELVPDGDGEQQGLEEVLQAEAALLASDLEVLEAEGCEPELLEELEAGVEGAAEALISMREARTKINDVKKDRGYGRAGGQGASGGGGPRPPKPHGNQVNSRKKTTTCFDCGLPGHWKGDRECKKPGAGLGAKHRGQGDSSKQVLIAESLNTEHVVPGEEEIAQLGSTNETLVVQHIPLMGQVSLSEALASTKTEMTSSPQQPDVLSKDKRLVGALDSACNRTVTGAVWLYGFLEKLKEAPEAIRSLVKREGEHEMFRFGNGGVQRSFERWRLPMVVGQTLILFWTSVVNVPSLGLLLGRDFLTGVGGVLSFTQRLLRCDHLGSTMVPLRQMAAGHFLLELIPACWPRPALGRWRRVGLDGVLELQVSAHEWIQRKLGGDSFFKHPTSEHFLTEHGVLAASVEHSGLSPRPDAGSDLNTLAREIMKVGCNPASATSTTSSSTRSSSTSKQHGDSKGLQGCGARQVVTNVDKTRGPRRLAHAGSLAMALATAWSAMATTSVPIGGLPGTVEDASREHGGKSSFSTPPLSQSSSTTTFQSGQSGRVLLPSQSHGFGAELSGGSIADGNDGLQGCQRNGQSNQGTGSTTSRSRSQESQSRRSSGSGRERTDWPSWRIADTSQGPLEVGGIGSRYRDRQDDRGSNQAGCSTGGARDGQRQHAEEIRSKLKWLGRGEPSKALGTKVSAGSRVPNNYNRRPAGHSAGGQQSVGQSGGKVPRDAFSVDEPHHDGSADFLPGKSDARSDADDRSSSTLHRRRGEQRPSHAFSLGPVKSTGLHPGGDRPDDSGSPGVPEGDRLNRQGVPLRLKEDYETGWNPWALNQELKTGVANMVSQAWEKHERDRRLVSQSRRRVMEVMEADWWKSMEDGMNEAFITAVDFGDRVAVSEVFTHTQRVIGEAARRGHKVGTPLSLETGWDFLREEDREAGKKLIRREQPYCLVLAFPCGPWSALTRLNPNVNVEELQRRGTILLKYALELAEIQLKGGRHFLLENPLTSQAWSQEDMKKFLDERDVHLASFHLCRFGLKGASGLHHRKATKVASSSREITSLIDGRKCLGDHVHQPVIGGSAISGPAGHYPLKFAKKLVDGIENEFNKETAKAFEVNALETPSWAFEEDEEEILRPSGSKDDEEELESDDGEKLQPKTKMKVTAALKSAIRRLHENTGHRSNLRLARALALSGAPPEVIHAAKNHYCSVCQEQKKPKSRRPASLPTPKDVGDQANIDLVEVYDSTGEKFYVVHMIDFCTRFQLAEVLRGKTAADVISFIRKRWLPIFGAPRVLVADQGREFISWDFEEFCSAHSILLWHCGVGAPWQNGICERAGGTLKVLLASIVIAHQMQGHDELEGALGEALSAYNQDINELGVSPAQAAVGRQPKVNGDVLNGVGNLAEHSLIEDKPDMSRQLAIRETAKVAMTRLHFSKGIRRAELARSRSSTVEQMPEPGAIVYFYRAQKYNSRTAPSRRRLTLKRWHGPALVVAVEGPNLYLSFKGQLTKCAAEHCRIASMMEQIAASTWRGAIEDAVEVAMKELRLVVPGFRDVSGYEIRKDAPTASRISQHLVMLLTSCNFKHGWRLWSADVKSAFLKGDAYMAGVRELYVSNIKTSSPDEPVLPLGPDGLARVRKGVFGLADAPRQWYLRLNRSLEAKGWKRSLVDSACWFLWAADGSLDGVVVSHVDDLLLGGNQKAQDELHALGEELGFGSVSKGSFQYCGKMIKQDEETGIITVSMVEYHDNLKTIEVPVHRRREGDSPLTPSEHKSLRALLGSLQWLVAQVRFDQGYQLSTLQGEPPVIDTILKANLLAKKMKQTKEFALTFKPFDLKGAGLIVVADASLGNVRRDGSAGADPFERVYSQSSYFVLVGDANLLAGKEGTFAILDARSHRLSRVCRSTFAAELYSTEEAFDIGMYCRGVLAEANGHSLGSKVVDAVLETVPLVVVTDAKDVYDKNTSDTPSYGSQKSLAFTVAWLRNLLRKEGTRLKWTSTENMWVDGGTKEMNLDHMHRIIQSCRWSMTYSPSFVKQPSKAKAKPIKPGLAVVGIPIGSDDAVFTHLLRLGDEPGWHLRGGVAIHVAKGARSYRLPRPRFEPEDYPLRSSYGRFDGSNGQSEWRRLEDHVSYQELPNKQALIGDHVPVLVTFFHAKPSSTNKEDISAED